MNSKSISEQLGKTGLVVCPHFLSKRGLLNTQNDYDEIQGSGRFARAGVGQGASNTISNIRQDEIHWIEKAQLIPAQKYLWLKLDLLKRALNRNLFLGISSFEGHYASYAKGGFYQRHLDSFSQDQSRIVSLIIYLNRNWEEKDGGRLRVYDHASFTDIDPLGGTLVCFMSRESEHEVLESFASRASFAGWFKVQPGKLLVS